MAQPWYMYPADSPGGGYGEMIDPVCAGGACHYLKPDTNIAIPSGVAITSPLAGTVSDVSNRGAGDAGLSVTVKLLQPLNSLAKYISFNYLGGANVSVGQSVSVGQKIGVAGSPTGINFALALGSDPSWGSGGGFAQNAVGNPLLDPRILLNALRGGKPLPTGTGGGGTTTTSGSGGVGGSYPTACAPWDFGCTLAMIADSNTTRNILIFVVAVIVLLMGIHIMFSGGS